MVTAHSAQRLSLSTPEILELILLQLDNQTLLTAAQQTCRGWRELIYRSPYLQKALFFLPESGRGDEEEKTQNPLLIRRFPSLFGKSNELGSLLPSLDMIKTPQKLEAYLRPEASWRRMLVQQPPVLVIGALESVYGMHDGHEFYEIHVSCLSCDEIAL
jgi:hypothetical protein